MSVGSSPASSGPLGGESGLGTVEGWSLLPWTSLRWRTAPPVGLVRHLLLAGKSRGGGALSNC